MVPVVLENGPGAARQGFHNYKLDVDRPLTERHLWGWGRDYKYQTPITDFPTAIDHLVLNYSTQASLPMVSEACYDFVLAPALTGYSTILFKTFIDYDVCTRSGAIRTSFSLAHLVRNLRSCRELYIAASGILPKTI